jgi:DNA invertase Pin-like site-specific DNA recombinase
MTLVGYARVSTHEQDPQLQTDALSAAGCERIYLDVASGARAERPELAAALDYLREGDQLVVWKLDRLGRSLSHLITTLDGLRERGVAFRSLTEGIDTTTAHGQLLFAVLGAFAQFERELIRERVTAGLAAARAAGRRGGRPRALRPSQLRYVQRQYGARTPVAELARELGVGRATIYRALAAADAAA